MKMDPYKEISKDFTENKKKFRHAYEEIGKKGHLPSGIARFEENLRVDILMKLLENTKDSILLDIGCGDGFVLKRINCKRKTGIDLSYNILEKAKSINIVTLICSDAEKLPFKDNVFDIIICTETLEHVLSPRIVMNEIYRVLKKDGNVYISIPYEHGIRPFLRKLLGWSDNPLHINRFRENEILNLLKDFDIEKVVYFPIKIILLDILIKAKKR